MKILLSPAKAINFEINIDNNIDYTIPVFLKETEKISSFLKTKNMGELSDIMKISDKLSMLNYYRFKNYDNHHNLENSKQSAYIFNGTVYQNIDISSLDREDIDYLQKNLFILSGFYGILRPLDIIQSYRLEMGTKISIYDSQNLYKFWSNKITEYINKTEQEFIINLASYEYSKVINKNTLKSKIIDIYFMNYKDGKYKNIPLYAKKARGKMVNFLAINKIKMREEIKLFDNDNYKFSNEISDKYNYVFVR